ncbi:hypothetical protein ElyMa_005490600 [Elysia marginata]|uniref:Uncharacterized protein n=1 Tax=Elysia marginata TaxID=1093978 RepID=A0AAV4ESC4_9GAST|nr:hypothetical protein ElyMa_005490600 [Elysia marginata]
MPSSECFSLYLTRPRTKVRLSIKRFLGEKQKALMRGSHRADVVVHAQMSHCWQTSKSLFTPPPPPPHTNTNGDMKLINLKSKTFDDFMMTMTVPCVTPAVWLCALFDSASLCSC